MGTNQDQPAICCETGLDEAFLVGTSEELIAFAQAVLDAAASQGELVDYLGIETRSVPRRLTELMADVVLGGVLIVESKQDRQILMNRIRENNGESPIDWAAREKVQQERQKGAAPE